MIAKVFICIIAVTICGCNRVLDRVYRTRPTGKEWSEAGIPLYPLTRQTQTTSACPFDLRILDIFPKAFVQDEKGWQLTSNGGVIQGIGLETSKLSAYHAYQDFLKTIALHDRYDYIEDNTYYLGGTTEAGYQLGIVIRDPILLISPPGYESHLATAFCISYYKEFWKTSGS